MSYLTIFGIAVALAMDAFAVSIAVGISLKKISPRQIFRLSYHFGLFQALMPVIGWWSGTAVRGFVEKYAPWIAFGLLAAVGTNMIREAFQLDQEEASEKDSTRGITLVILSIATSIDALAVGFSLSLLNQAIATPAIIIGIVAALFTIVGMHLGTRVANLKHLSLYAELLGGTVLWLIGFKILHENGILSIFT
jgi:manganese efflux pump family protein